MVMRYFGLVFFSGFVLGTLYSTAGDLTTYLDVPSLIIVLAAGISLAIGASPQKRLEKFGEGCVRGGWIGFLIGLVIISSNVVGGGDWVALGSALGVCFLTPLWGYIIQFGVNIFVE